MNENLASTEAHLRRYAELDRFWILRTKHIQPGLIHYSDSHGNAFALMDDNDDRVEQCIKLLESKNCPVFDDVAVMDQYAQEIAAKTRC